MKHVVKKSTTHTIKPTYYYYVFSVMWSDLLMTSAISCPLWSSVYECQRVKCAFTSPVITHNPDLSQIYAFQ